MAEITKTSLSGGGTKTATVTTLGASDTFTYSSGDILHIENVTAGAITPNLDGDGSTTVALPGVGSIDVSGGYTTDSIGIGAKAVIPLDSVSAYLKGTVTVTGGDGAEVYITTK